MTEQPARPIPDLADVTLAQRLDFADDYLMDSYDAPAQDQPRLEASSIRHIIVALRKMTGLPYGGRRLHDPVKPATPPGTWRTDEPELVDVGLDSHRVHRLATWLNQHVERSTVWHAQQLILDPFSVPGLLPATDERVEPRQAVIWAARVTCPECSAESGERCSSSYGVQDRDAHPGRIANSVLASLGLPT